VHDLVGDVMMMHAEQEEGGMVSLQREVLGRFLAAYEEIDVGSKSGSDSALTKDFIIRSIPTVTDVMILNYAVGLDVARDGTQSNTQDVRPCKLPIDSLPLQLLAKSPKLM